MMPDDFRLLVREYQSEIDDELRSLVHRQEPTYLYDPVRYALQGKGKRLRPILALLAAKLFRAPEEEAMHAALSVEILHNFSLIHDDIMDQDDMRHGLPSIFRKWDESTAILAGDVIFALAYVELAKVKTDPLRCLQVFNDATIKLCEGQALDKAFESQENVTPDEYLEMVRLKTGTLLSLSCKLGAIIGNASLEDEVELAQFGEILGQTFQIQDDVLEIFSSSEKMGKSLGSDVVSQKKTYLTCRALEMDPLVWNDLMESLKGKDLESDVLPALRLYFEKSGIMVEAGETIDRLVTLSRSKLKRFDKNSRQYLEHFVEMLIVREK